MRILEPEKVATHLFRTVWQLLAYVDLCDAYGSVECLRVRRLWLDAGCPVPVAPFITQHANAPAGGDK